MKSLEWLLSPISTDEFLESYFEKTYLHIPANAERSSGYYTSLFSSEMVKQALQKGTLLGKRDVDVTIYENGKRRDLLQEGERAEVDQVLRKFERDHCSVRLLRPQEHAPKLMELLSKLEEDMASSVFSSNSYWTPVSSQGFAPHSDDVDVFILQIEGCKTWHLYNAIEEGFDLARYPSQNYDQAQVAEAHICTIELTPGSLLYLPRGMVHQAATPSTSKEASLHVTVSCGHRNSWADFLLALLPRAVEEAALQEREFRESVPVQYLSYMGVMHKPEEPEADIYEVEDDAEGEEKQRPEELEEPLLQRRQFRGMLRQLIRQLEKYALVEADEAADEKALEFLQDRHRPVNVPLPPAPDLLRVQTALTARLVVEEDKCCVYHCLGNSGGYRANKDISETKLEFPLDAAPLIEAVLKSYPQEFKQGDVEGDEWGVVETLMEAGVIVRGE